MTHSIRLIFFTVAGFFAAGVLAQQSTIFSDNEHPLFENTYLIDNISNNSIGGDLTLRINKKAPFDCKTRADCPASVILSNANGSVNMPVDVNVKSLSVGKILTIDSSGRWVGPNSGLIGPKGNDGKSGESCVPGAGIYPSCLDGLINQKLFKMVYSDIGTQDCKYFSAGYQKKFATTCPPSHPNIVGGGCELRTVAANIAMTSSEPLKSGTGWQCEMVTTDGDLCQIATLRVWASCARAGVDYASIQ